MAADGKKGITVKVDAALHAEITQYLQDHGMTMTEFVTLALQDELHPKIDEKEGKNMEKMRTLAFQVPESLFQRIKDYLHRNNMTQKDFVIGLIEQELDRDLAESQETGEAQGDFEDTEELEDTEQLDADQELPGDQETASSVEEMDETEPSIPDQEVPETSEEGPDAEELDDEMSLSEETGEADYQDDEDMSEDALEDEGEEETEEALEDEYLFQSHDYRHTVATMLYDNGVSIQGVRDYLGHDYLEMTEQSIDYMPKKIAKENMGFFQKPEHNLAAGLRKKGGRDGK